MTAPVDGAATLRKAGRENFPVAPAFLPPGIRDELMAVYGFARLVDDLGDGDAPFDGPDATLLLDAAGLPRPERDGAEARLTVLDAFQRDVERAWTGEARHPLLAALTPAIRRAELPVEPFLRLVEANRQDQKVDRYPTWQDLADYCELSANPVGHLVLLLAGKATARRVEHSDRICTALQVVEHLQDVAEDHRRGRIYLPGEDLAAFGVAEDDLAAPHAGRRLRSLIGYHTERSRELLLAGAPLVGSVTGRLRLLLAGFVGGGLAAADAIRAADYDVLAGAPTAGKASVLRHTAAVLGTRGRG